jgi:uncharacterized membrane protein YdjX (TVP38/TMEM64 family)
VNSSVLRLLRSLLLGIVLVGIVWGAWRLVPPGQISIEGMRALLDAHAPYGALVFMAMVVAGIFTRVPMMATLLIGMGAIVLGRLSAFVYGWVAALVGTTGTFLFVRYVARDYLQRVLYGFSTRLQALDDRLTRHGFRTVLALRLVFGLAPLLNWGLGLTGIRGRHYVAGTALGVVPNIAIAVFFADYAATLSTANGLPSARVLLGSLAAIAIVGVMFNVVRRLTRHRTPPAVY